MSTDRPMAGATSIIWSGTNSLHNPWQTMQDIAATVDAHRAASDAPFYVVTIQPAWEGVGGQYYNNRQTINGWIHQMYGERTIPLADYVGNGVLYDSGAFRTQQDVDQLAQGLMPRSIWGSATDNVHFSEAGNRAVAHYFASFVRDGNTYSKAQAKFDAVTQMNVGVQGSRVTISGHAYDHSDLLAPINVGVSIDSVWQGATLAGKPSPQLHAYGVAGGHGYDWSFDLAPGTHSVCTVAVNIGLGANQFACTNIEVAASTPPVGDIAIAGGSGNAAIYGWAYDPDAPRESLTIAVLIDGRWHTAIKANGPTPYLQGIPGAHSYWTAAGLSKGQHSACTVAYGTDGQTTTLGCRAFTVS